MNRRQFIQNTGLTSLGLALSNNVFSAERKIKIAVLGTGWFGSDLLLPNALASGKFEIVALCDVNQKAFQKSLDVLQKAGLPKPVIFSDYKKMYEMPDLEAVIIASRTHWHALQFIDACKKGLHVFLEKPVSFDIAESKAMMTAHQKAGNVVVVDFERVQFGINEQIKAYIDSDAAGTIRQVLVNLHNPEGSVVEKPVPNHIDFEAFCGPAPKQKFLCNPDSDTPNWRANYAFGHGTMIDWGSHYLHNARKVMGLGLPDSVMATGGNLKNIGQEQPDYMDVHFKYGNLPVQYSQRAWGYQSLNPDTNIGVWYMGEKATIFEGEFGWEVYPEGGKPKINHGEIGFKPWTEEFNVKMNDGIKKQFVELYDGIMAKSNKNISAPLSDAIQTNTAMIMADLAYRTGMGIVTKESLNPKSNTMATQLLKREYRAGYKHPSENI
jgi:predicted dehydrogenase